MNLILSRERLSRFLFWMTVYVAVFYSSYRYPFKINFSGTSPTYVDTPPMLQAGKYVILVLACIAMIVVARKFYVRQGKLLFLLFYLSISLYPVIQFVYDGSSKNLVFPFTAIAVLLISMSVRKINIRDVDACIRIILYVSLIVNFIELALFGSIGRLPALAYPNSLSVRFGSFLDDPNGFGALLFLLLGYEFLRQRSTNRRWLLVGVIVSIFLTQSLTAIGFFLLIFGFWIFRHYLKTSIIIAGAVVYLTIAIVASFDITDNALLNAVYMSKRASVTDHLVSFDGRDSAVLDWLIGRFEYLQYESWWASSATNYGLIWTFALVVLLIMFMIKLWNLNKNTSSPVAQSVIWGFFLFSLYFILGSANLSFLLIFPINFLFLLFLILFMFEKIDFSST